MPGLNVTASDLTVLVPGLDTAVAAQQVEHTLALARLKAPCLFHNDAEADKVAAGRAILINALSAWGEQRATGLGARQTRTRQGGTFSETETIDTRGRRVDPVDDVAWGKLAALCSAEPEGLPRHTFPPSDGLARLFGC